MGAAYRSDVSQSRPVTLLHEIDVNGIGKPRDLVPGAMTEQSFQLDRWDLYSDIMEEVFTGFEMEMLCHQRFGFRLREEWKSPYSLLNSGGSLYEYRPCFFESLGRSLDASGDRTVSVSARIVWLDRIKIV